MSSEQLSTYNNLFDDNFDIDSFIDEVIGIDSNQLETELADSEVVYSATLPIVNEGSNSKLTNDDSRKPPMTNDNDSFITRNSDFVSEPCPSADSAKEQNFDQFETASIDSGNVSISENGDLANLTITFENDSFRTQNIEFSVPAPVSQLEKENSTEKSNRNRVCQICYHINEPRMTEVLLNALPRALGTRGCMCGPIHTCGLHPEQKQTIHADCFSNKSKRIRYRLRKFKKY